MNKKFAPAALAVLGLAAVLVCGCKKKTDGGAMPAPVVSAVTVLQQDLPWNIEYPAQVAG